MWGKYGGRTKGKSSTYLKESPECCKILLELGAQVDSLDNNKTTPLGIACGTGGVKCIEMLIAAGSNINHQNIDGMTPLHICMLRDNIDCL